MTTLYFLQLTLGSSGFNWLTYTYVGERKKKVYDVTLDHKDSSMMTVVIGTNKRIEITGLLKTDSYFIKTHKKVSLFLWHLSEQESEAREILMEAVIKEANKIRAEAMAMFAHLPTQPVDEE